MDEQIHSQIQRLIALGREWIVSFAELECEDPPECPTCGEAMRLWRVDREIVFVCTKRGTREHCSGIADLPSS